MAFLVKKQFFSVTNYLATKKLLIVNNINLVEVTAVAVVVETVAHYVVVADGFAYVVDFEVFLKFAGFEEKGADFDVGGVFLHDNLSGF